MSTDSSRASNPRVPTIFFAATILLGAFLLFQVQPLIAKLILPWFGGSAAVWTSCMLFFQLALLGGYAYAHWLIDHPGRKQTIIHIGLLFISLVSLPILPSVWWKPSGPGEPLLRIFGLLAVTVGLPYFLLSSTSPLLQAWYSRSTGGKMPYRFFALSNMGSMLGLLSYPVLVEPNLTNRAQAWMWSCGYIFFALVCGTVAFRSRGDGVTVAASQATPSPAAKPALGQKLIWMALAACASALLLAITNHMTQNVAPIPFLWVLPLCLYLLSFILCFDSDRWYRRRFFLTMGAIAMAAMTWQLIDGGIYNLRAAVGFFCVTVFVIFMLCHGELARRRPAPAYLTGFYLMVSVGGAVGGLLIGFAAPFLFNGLYDLPVVLCLTVLLFAWLMWNEHTPRPEDLVEDQARENPLIMTISAVMIAFILYRVVGAWRFGSPKFLAGLWDPAILYGISGTAVAYVLARPRSRIDTRLLAFIVSAGLAIGVVTALVGDTWRETKDARLLVRNFYGALKVHDAEGGPIKGPVRILKHGTIDHGEQFLRPENSRLPTAYFTEKSGIGRAMLALQADGPKNIGIVGLGAGTLAAYAQKADHLRYYDINPLVKQVAETEFTFLRDCPAPHEVVLGDARLVMENEPIQNFDLLVVDAFSGDAIPVHLLTSEAWKLYWLHLKPNGVLAVHVSNRYLRLAPVVAMGATANGKRAMILSYDGLEEEEAASDWVLVTSRAGFFDRKGISATAREITPIAGLRPWTDDYSNIYRILR